MGKEYLKNGKLNPDLIPTTGTPTRYNLNTIDKVIGF